MLRTALIGGGSREFGCEETPKEDAQTQAPQNAEEDALAEKA
jgi:hypothetical protein